MGFRNSEKIRILWLKRTTLEKLPQWKVTKIVATMLQILRLNAPNSISAGATDPTRGAYRPASWILGVLLLRGEEGKGKGRGGGMGGRERREGEGRGGEGDGCPLSKILNTSLNVSVSQSVSVCLSVCPCLCTDSDNSRPTSI